MKADIESGNERNADLQSENNSLRSAVNQKESEKAALNKQVYLLTVALLVSARFQVDGWKAVAEAATKRQNELQAANNSLRAASSKNEATIRQHEGEKGVLVKEVCP
jgi:hypothetical protein